MKSQLFDLNGFEKTAHVEAPTIPTSLGPLYCSLRRTLPNDSFHEILGQPDAMFESQSKSDTRIYIWETDQVSAALSIEKVIPKSTSVENKYFVDWRTELKDPSLRLTSRVGFNGSGHSFSLYERTGDTSHDSAIWTNEDFVSEQSLAVSVVAIAGPFGREVDFMTDQWGVYGDLIVNRELGSSRALFAIVTGSNARETYTEPPEFAGVLHLNESQLFDFEEEVDPSGRRI